MLPETALVSVRLSVEEHLVNYCVWYRSTCKVNNGHGQSDEPANISLLP